MLIKQDAITDIHALNVEMDAEDRELMEMFPANRQIRLDDKLLIQDGEQTYLVDKSSVVDVRKILQDAFDFVTLSAATYIILADTVMMVKRFVSPLVGLPILGAALLGFVAVRMVVKQYRCRHK